MSLDEVVTLSTDLFLENPKSMKIFEGESKEHEDF
jgi:hypothetical protein